MRLNRVLTVASLIATLGLTSVAEFMAALTLGYPMWLAWLFPVSLDCYVLSAMRAGRDKFPALVLGIATVGAAHALPKIYGATMPWPIVWLGTGLPFLVLWRVHVLAHIVPVPSVVQVDPPRPRPVRKPQAALAATTPPALTRGQVTLPADPPRGVKGSGSGGHVDPLRRGQGGSD
jgi:hypothetical protein